MADHEKKEAEEDVEGHAHWHDSSAVGKHEQNVGLHKDDEDDVEGHKFVTDPDSVHTSEPESKPEY